jgi:acyl-CoA reductase-like NAD-dependent aldehyde dehydrogenase
MSTSEVATETAEAVQSTPHQLYVAGQWTDPISDHSLETIDPSTGKTLRTVADAGSDDVDAAVAAAQSAFASAAWSRSRPSEREAWLHKIADLLEADREAFALLETLDNGMPIRLAQRLVDRAVENLRYYAGWPTKLVGDTISPSTAAGSERLWAFTLREPLGVVAAIIPWNASITSATTKLGPALACGNAVILKPSENTPLTVLRLARLIEQADLPVGVVNVLSGGPEAGRALAEHKGVQMVAFTGSTATGQQIVRASAGNLKRVLIELGGKSPNIIFADADLTRAIPTAARAVFGNSGQVCTAGSRIFVERAVYEEVVEGIRAFAERLRIGHGVNPKTQMGPVISERQRARILELVASGENEGARLVAGGRAVEREDLDGGFFVAPTVFADVRSDMRIVKEEIFGPVAAVTSFEDVLEVIDYANDTEYGLAAGVWTSDITKAHVMANAIHAGTIWVNTYMINEAAVPFGGYGLSGYGREYGYESLDQYTQIKSVWHSYALPDAEQE